MPYLSRIIVFILTFCSSVICIADEPMSVTIDPRVRTLQYFPNEVYLLRGQHGFHTTIQLNADEKIQSIDLGDSSAWNLQANGNIVTLKPITDNAETNMTIHTDKRLYLFQLTTPPLKRDENDVPIFVSAKEALFLLQFTYPQTRIKLGESRLTAAGGLVIPPSKVRNAYYTARGDHTVLPRAVYDDGQFTYLDFTGIQPLPAVFSVDKKRNESVINKRLTNEWLVIEGVHRQYTLRHGNQIASIFNDVTIHR